MASVTIDHFDSNNSSQATGALTITKTAQTITAIIGTITYKFQISLTSLSYKKKIYQPNEAIADVSISKTNTSSDIFPNAENVAQLFLSKVVTLDLDGAGKAINHFIQEVVPKVSSGKISLTLKIYSMDKLMTLDKYSQAYSGRKLRKELIASVNRFQFSYSYYSAPSTAVTNKVNVTEDGNKIETTSTDSSGKTIGTSYDSNQLQHLSDGYYTTSYTKDKVNYTYSIQNEFIHPYLVQYNESFYDFLVRVSNRCGEFLYFEDGVLKIGLPQIVDYSTQLEYTVGSSSSKKILYGIKDLHSPIEITNYSSVEMANSISGVFNVGDYYRNSLADKNEISDSSDTNNHGEVSGGYSVNRIYKNSGSKETSTYPSDTNFDKTGYFYNSEYAHDEFFMPLYKDGFGGNTFIELNRGSQGKHVAHMVEQIFNSTSLFELLSNAAIEYTELGLLNLKYHGTMNDRGKDRFIQPNAPSYASNINSESFTKEPDVVVPFSENKPSRWTTIEYYSDIRYFQELLTKKMIKVCMGTNLKDIKLGNIIKVPDLGSSYYVVTEINTTISSDSSSQELYAIPLLTVTSNKIDYHIAYPPLLNKEVFRKSGPQTAFVVDSADPKRQGRVRIRYPWQTKEDNIPNDANIQISDAEQGVWGKYTELKKEAATPWVRMLTPAASHGSGIYFEAEPGDEVLVNFENDNVERPYVVGSLYSKNHTAPTNKGQRVIVSKFGHMIRFKDPYDGVGEISDSTGAVRWVSSFSPLLDTFSFWFGDLIPNFDGTTDQINKLTGGIDIGDAYGMYNISTSSDERTIKISSPFGNISLNAFTGITIKAPNGNIKIEGKNIDLIASNKVNITSGENLKKRSWWSGGLGGDTLEETVGNVASAFGEKVFDTLVDKFQPIDFDLIRTLFEVVIRPVNGTLSLKSYGFIRMEAGEGKAQIRRNAYTERYVKNVLNTSDGDSVVDAYQAIHPYIDAIKQLIDSHYAQVRLLTNTINLMLNQFIDKYHGKNGAIRKKSRDELVDLLYGNNLTPYVPDDVIDQDIRFNILLGMDELDIDDDKKREAAFMAYLDQIHNDFFAMYIMIHNKNGGLIELMSLDYIKNNIKKWIGNNFDQKFIDMLKRHISTTYNNSQHYFAFCKNVNEQKYLLQRTGYVGMTEATLDNQMKYLVRVLIKNFFDEFKTFFPDFELVTGPSNSILSVNGSWNNYINGIQIKRDQTALTSLIRGKFDDFEHSFKESLSTWEDNNHGRGKIVISDNAVSSWSSGGDRNSFVRTLNRQDYPVEQMNTSKNRLLAKLRNM